MSDMERFMQQPGCTHRGRRHAPAGVNRDRPRARWGSRRKGEWYPGYHRRDGAAHAPPRLHRPVVPASHQESGTRRRRLHGASGSGIEPAPGGLRNRGNPGDRVPGAEQAWIRWRIRRRVVDRERRKGPSVRVANRRVASVDDSHNAPAVRRDQAPQPPDGGVAMTVTLCNQARRRGRPAQRSPRPRDTRSDALLRLLRLPPVEYCVGAACTGADRTGAAWRGGGAARGAS